MKRLKLKAYLFLTLILGVFILPGCGDVAGGGHWDKPVTVTVTPVTASIPVGGTQQFIAMATFADGTTQNVTENAGTIWTTVNLPSGVATLSANGVVGAGRATGVLSGTADITATFNTMSDTSRLTVNAAVLTSVTVTPLTASIPVGGDQQFIAMANYSFGPSIDVTENAETIWTAVSTPAGVATLSTSGVVGAGLATGNIGGTADITATFLSQSDTVTLTVNSATLVSVTVTPATASIQVGGTQQFTAMANYSFGPDINVTRNAGTVWTAVSVPAGVANMSTNGVLGAGLATGANGGTATITATFKTINGTATLTVIEATLVSVIVTPVTASIPLSGTQQFLAMANYSFGPDVDVTEDAGTIWTSVNVPVGGALVATLSPNGLPGAGLATGANSGTADITATYKLKNDTARLTVDPALVVIIIPGAVCSVDAGPTIPTVTESNPTDGNLKVTTSTAGVANNGKLITANFSMAMDPLTIESATAPLTFTIFETLSPLVTVSGTVTMDLTNKIATFTTDAALVENRAYTASITIDAMSAGGVAIACAYEWNFTTVTPPVIGIGAVNFGSAATFGIASTAGIDNVNGTTVTTVNGDVVLDPNFTCNSVTVGSAGLIGSCNGMAPVINGTVISQLYPDAGVTSGKVVLDLRAAYDALSPAKMSTGVTTIADGTTMGSTAVAPVLNDNLFYPGIYKTTSGGMLITGDLTLDAKGDQNAVFVFQSDSTLKTAATGAAAPHTRILLVNGAKAANVYWWLGTGGDATLGTYTIFNGNVLSYRSITMETGASSCGRLFAGAFTDGKFTFGENIVSVPGSVPGCE